jgi:serine/threonine protein phosphatase 1
LTKQVLYFIDEDNNCFVHGGFNRHELMKDQSDTVFLWDRDLFLAALSYKNLSTSGYSFKMANKFKNVFIGHTPTTNWNTSQPIFAANIINVDTGAGFKNGRLTIMNLETQEYFQSSKVKEKYLSMGR